MKIRRRTITLDLTYESDDAMTDSRAAVIADEARQAALGALIESKGCYQVEVSDEVSEERVEPERRR